MHKIAIYGAGDFGRYIYNEINVKNEKIETVCFIDNHKTRDYTNLNMPFIVNIDMFMRYYSYDVDTVIIANTDEMATQEMILSLLPDYKGNIIVANKNVYHGMLEVIKGDGFYDYIKNYRSIKPILSYVEFDVTNFCNLKCKNCGHKSDLSKKMMVADFEQFEKDVKRLAELFSNVIRFRLMGGEPFLVKDLGKYVKCVRDNFPRAGIMVVTNGLLIDKINDDLLKEFHRLDIAVEVSQYPPTRKMTEKIISRFDKNDVQVSIGRLIDSFMKREEYDFRGNLGPADISYNNCPNRFCHSLIEGRLMMCGVVWSMAKSDSGKLLEECNMNSIDLTKRNYDGWDALLLLEKPIPLCSRCINSLIKKYEPWEAALGDE